MQEKLDIEQALPEILQTSVRSTWQPTFPHFLHLKRWWQDNSPPNTISINASEECIGPPAMGLSVEETGPSPLSSMMVLKTLCHTSISHRFFSNILLTMYLLFIVWGMFALVIPKFSCHKVKQYCQILLTKNYWNSPHFHHLCPPNVQWLSQRSLTWLNEFSCTGFTSLGQSVLRFPHCLHYSYTFHVCHAEPASPGTQV